MGERSGARQRLDPYQRGEGPPLYPQVRPKKSYKKMSYLKKCLIFILGCYIISYIYLQFNLLLLNFEENVMHNLKKKIFQKLLCHKLWALTCFSFSKLFPMNLP